MSIRTATNILIAKYYHYICCSSNTDIIRIADKIDLQGILRVNRLYKLRKDNLSFFIG